MKRQSIGEKKIFANYIFHRGLVSSICKELLKVNSKKASNPIRKWAQVTNRHFTEKDVQMANKHTKRYSTSLAIREM